MLNYGQFGTAIVAAFFVTPIILRRIEPRQYGLWLSTGELVSFSLLLDFGVAAVLPWLIAQAEGAGRLDKLRRTLAQAASVALSLSALLVAVAFGLWQHLPRLLGISAADWQELRGPLAWMVALLAANLPLNLFTALLIGKQDVKFCGILNLFKCTVGPALTTGLLLTGHGLYSLALGTGVLPPLCGLASAARAWRISPELLRGWPLPSAAGTMRLFRESIGAWLAGAGVQIVERSNGVVLTMMGNPAIVPTLVCTARASQILTQMAWVIPDSALVGVANLSGENNPDRLREVVLSIIRLTMVIAGLAACLVLAVNPAFVRLWVGTRFFGGLPLNSLLALEIFSGSMAHALMTLAAAQGQRFGGGLATLMQGVVYLVVAVPLTRRFSIEGLLIADVLAPVLSTLPAGFWLLRSANGVDFWQIGRELVILLLLRTSPCLLVAGLYGAWRAGEASLLELAVAGAAICFIYLRAMGSLLGTFPLPAKVKTWLRRFHLVGSQAFA